MQSQIKIPIPTFNLRSVKNHSSKSVEHLFRTTEKFITEQTEIAGLSTINWDQTMWRESSLLCDRALRNYGIPNLRLFLLGANFGRHQSRTSSRTWL